MLLIFFWFLEGIIDADVSRSRVLGHIISCLTTGREYRYGMESNTLAGIVWNTLVILTAIYDMYLNGTPFHTPGQCYRPGFCHPYILTYTCYPGQIHQRIELMTIHMHKESLAIIIAVHTVDVGEESPSSTSSFIYLRSSLHPIIKHTHM